MSANFEQDLAALVEGSISEIEVAPSDFLTFRNAWAKRPDSKEIIGTAQRDGKVIYHFQKSASN